MGGVCSIKEDPTCLERTDENGAALSGSAPKVFYHQRQVTDRLSNLKVTMIKKNCTAKPKLRCSAAECRALVPFLVELAESVLSDDLLDELVTVAARRLLDCYMARSSDSVFAEDVLRGSSEKFAQKLVALESVDPGRLEPEAEIPPLAGAVCVWDKTVLVLDVQGRRLRRDVRAWHAREAGI